MTALVLLTPVISYADNGYKMTCEEFYAVDEVDINCIKMEIEESFGDAAKYNTDYVFIPSSGNAYSVNRCVGIKTKTEIVNGELNIGKMDGNICICRYETGSQGTVNISMIYSASSNEDIPGFKISGGKIVSAKDIENARIEKCNNGRYTLTLSLSQNEIERLSRWIFSEGRMSVLTTTSDNADIIVESIGIETERGTYAYARAMTEEFNYLDYSAIVMQETQEETTTEYICEDEQIHVISSANTENVLNECIENCSVMFSEDTSISIVDEAHDATEETDEEQSIMETDIEDHGYNQLSDSSVLYTDSYLYSSDLNPYALSKLAVGRGYDFYGNIYAATAMVSEDNMYLDSPSMLLGCNASDIILTNNSMKFTVSNVKDSEYAGNLKFVTDDYCDSNYGFERNTGVEDTSLTDEGAEETMHEELSVPISITFSKGDGIGYQIDSSAQQLTEAFLKKSSYCAVDSDGIICAIYNEHGRLLELAEGYEEGDVAGYVLIPAADENEITISEVSVEYNDALSIGQNYVSVEYIDDSLATVDPIFNISAYVDADTKLSVDILADYATKQFTYSTDSDNLEIIQDSDSEYYIAAVSDGNILEKEAEQILETEDGESGEELSTEVVEQTGEIVEKSGESSTAESGVSQDEDTNIVPDSETTEADLPSDSSGNPQESVEIQSGNASSEIIVPSGDMSQVASENMDDSSGDIGNDYDITGSGGMFIDTGPDDSSPPIAVNISPHATADSDTPPNSGGGAAETIAGAVSNPVDSTET